MLDRLGHLYAYLFGWPFLARLHVRLLYFCARALGLHNYTSSSISGEKRAMRLAVVGKTAPVVFDVGANDGQWITEMLTICPSARIHAFEPQNGLATRIAATHPGVTVNNLALGEVAGTLELFDYANQPGSQHASLLEGVIDGIHHGSVRSQKVELVTLDDYCAQHQVDHIDLLKIDVEGFELRVLQGARRLLRENRIDVIQFEFNEMNVIARTFMRDFFSCLSDSHRLYRLLPHGLLPLKPAPIWLNEQFVFQNIVALRKE